MSACVLPFRTPVPGDMREPPLRADPAETRQIIEWFVRKWAHDFVLCRFPRSFTARSSRYLTVPDVTASRFGHSGGRS